MYPESTIKFNLGDQVYVRLFYRQEWAWVRGTIIEIEGPIQRITGYRVTNTGSEAIVLAKPPQYRIILIDGATHWLGAYGPDILNKTSEGDWPDVEYIRPL